MWGRRAAAAAAVAMLAMLAVATPAQAQALQGNARFASPGVRVHDLTVLGVGCLAAGYCDGVTPATIANTPTVRRADRKGEAMLVLCRVLHARPDDDVLKVRLSAGEQTLAGRLADPTGAGTVDGLVSARQVDDVPPVDACGLLN